MSTSISTVNNQIGAKNLLIDIHNFEPIIAVIVKTTVNVPFMNTVVNSTARFHQFCLQL